MSSIHVFHQNIVCSIQTRIIIVIWLLFRKIISAQLYQYIGRITKTYFSPSFLRNAADFEQ
jgi:hypothetical protein